MPSMTALPRDARLKQRALFSHWVTERVRWSDTDQVGHVNNLAFGAYFESGRTELFRDLVCHAAESRVLLLVAQMNICFVGEAHWPSDIDIGTCVLDIGGSSCRLGQGLFLGDRCVGTADTVMVIIDEATRTPSDIPPHVRDYLNGFRAVEK